MRGFHRLSCLDLESTFNFFSKITKKISSENPNTMDWSPGEPMEICPPSLPLAHCPGKLYPGAGACNSPLCPVKYPHALGLFMLDGKPPRAQDVMVFRGSNLPRFCLDATRVEEQWRTWRSCKSFEIFTAKSISRRGTPKDSGGWNSSSRESINPR